MKKRAFYIAVLLLFVAVMPLHAAPTEKTVQPSDLEVLSSFENAIARVVNQSKPAVVSLFTEKVVGEDNNTQFESSSGFIFDQAGYILTTAHVVEGSKSFHVALFDGDFFDARLVGADILTNIAVLKIEGDRAFPTLRIADSKDVRVGQFAIAIGYPMGFGYTVTSGIVGGKGRSFHQNNNLFQYHHNYIQTDAWINPGNSGGPLLNIKAEVIGVTAAWILNPGEGATLAVDGGLAKQIAHQLIAHGRIIRGYFGAQLENAPQGFAVAAVKPGTATARSGLKRNDIIVTFDGKKMSDPDLIVPKSVGNLGLERVRIARFDGKKMSNLIAFERRLMDYQIGQRCALKVLRQGQEITLHVLIDEMPPELVGRAVQTESAAWQTLGLAVRDFTVNAHQRYAYLTVEDRGVLVEKVKKDSPSFKAKILRGALIVAINGQKIVDTQTLEKFLQTAQDIAELTFDIIGVDGKESVTIQRKTQLDALLQKITFLHTDLSGDSVTELVFDNTYKIENDEGEGYRLLRNHAIAGNKYIFAIISESGGGTGIFYSLHAVDKQTLRTLDSVAIGDRARIEKMTLIDKSNGSGWEQRNGVMEKKMTLIDKSNEILSITFTTKGDAYTPSKKVEKTFQINESDLLEELTVSP